MKVYKIAIIGCGMISKSHIAAIGKLPNAAVAAVADIVPDKARHAAEKTGCPYFESAKEMLDAVPCA